MAPEWRSHARVDPDVKFNSCRCHNFCRGVWESLFLLDKKGGPTSLMLTKADVS